MVNADFNFKNHQYLVTFGTRLPIMQGGSFAFCPQVVALLSQPSFSCELVTKTPNGTLFVDYGGVHRTYEELWIGFRNDFLKVTAITYHGVNIKIFSDLK